MDFSDYTPEELQEIFDKHPWLAIVFARYIRDTHPVEFWASVVRYFRKQVEDGATDAEYLLDKLRILTYEDFIEDIERNGIPDDIPDDSDDEYYDFE